MIVRRVKAGLAAGKAKGLRLGRVPLPMCLLRFPIQQLPPERTTFRAAWNTPQIAADCPPRGRLLFPSGNTKSPGSRKGPPAL